MKKKSLLLFSLCFILHYSWAQSPEENLTRFLSNYTTYQADFVQQNFSEGHKLIQNSRGKIYMLRPGRFRWQTTQPYQQIVVANGDKVWVYDVDLGQVTQQSLGSQGFNPGELLTLPATDLAQKFVVSEQPNGWFQLQPRYKMDGFALVYIQFKQNKLTALRIINQLNQTNNFNFYNIRVNHNLNPNIFELQVSKNVEVLKRQR